MPVYDVETRGDVVADALAPTRFALSVLAAFAFVALAFLVGLGIAIGLPGALLLTRVLQSLLFDVSPLDAVTHASLTLLMLVVGAISCLLPTRRALRVDPAIALKSD